MITTETTQFEVKDKVAWITLNRPAAMNSINPELRWQLSEHLNEVENNDDIWPVSYTHLTLPTIYSV